MINSSYYTNFPFTSSLLSLSYIVKYGLNSSYRFYFPNRKKSHPFSKKGDFGRQKRETEVKKGDLRRFRV